MYLQRLSKGRGIYGARQIMDITHPVYRYYAERVIRKLMEVSAHRKCVIGFQLDNETKYYGTAGKNVQLGFVKYLREKFNNDLDALNRRVLGWIMEQSADQCMGRFSGCKWNDQWKPYWSFEKYQRSLVEEFLAEGQRLFQNIREKISLSPTIWILNGVAIPMVCNRM